MEQNRPHNTTKNIEEIISVLIEEPFSDPGKKQNIFATIIRLYQENNQNPEMPLYKFLAFLYRRNPNAPCKNLIHKVLIAFPDPLNSTVDVRHLSEVILQNHQDSLGPYVRNFFNLSLLMTKFLFPLEHIFNETLLCFKSLHSCLKFAIPTLRVINKYCSWMLGVGFILEGIILYIEAMQESNTDPIQRLEAFFYIVGGLSCLAVLTLQPHVYLAVLTVVWGSSAAISISKSIYLLYKNFQAKKLLMDNIDNGDHTRESLLMNVQELLLNSSIDQYQAAYLESRIEQLHTDEDESPDSFNFDTLNTRLTPIQSSNPFTNNVFLSNLYLGFSFVCIALSFYGPSVVDLYAVTGFVLSTVLMVGKRFYDYFTNPAVEYAQQNPFISGEQTSEMNSDYAPTPNLKNIEEQLNSTNIVPNTDEDPELQVDILCGLTNTAFAERLTALSTTESVHPGYSSPLSTTEFNPNGLTPPHAYPDYLDTINTHLPYPSTHQDPHTTHHDSYSFEKKSVLIFLTVLTFAAATISISSGEGIHF
ncbi:MAG: hypothetical protein VX737_01375 [Pseudomonadota bacterium]|nr:hypothetical protein [Pseudomonadota bacterium]